MMGRTFFASVSRILLPGGGSVMAIFVFRWVLDQHFVSLKICNELSRQDLDADALCLLAVGNNRKDCGLRHVFDPV